MRRRAGGYVLAVMVGLVLGAGLGRALVYPPAEPATAMYRRSAALGGACEAAGAEISKLRRATLFVDNCSLPVVTPLLGEEEGQVIVTRMVEGAPDDGAPRVIYSVKMDGRGTEKWQVLELRRAPRGPTLDASVLPAKRSTTPASAQR